jgi:serine/threonine protein kinase
MGMSEEEFRKSLEVSSKKTSDAASDAASELKPRAPSPLDAYVFAKQLGVGLTGSVYKAWRRVPDGSVGSDPKSAPARYVPVAVKVMDKVKILDINETAHVVQESKIMRSVSRHPFIVSMIESFQTESAMFIAMEYAAAKDLFHMIHEHGALRLSQCRAFVVQTVLALDHVHAKGFVYRDLKPENLLVREDGYLRLTDFGFAKALRPGERAYTVCGTPDYLAPETLRQQGCTRAADFWAVGVLLFEMLTGYPPFHGQTHSELYRRITSGRMRAFPRSFDEDAADLVNKLLRQSEGERIGVGRRRHPADPTTSLLQGVLLDRRARTKSAHAQARGRARPRPRAGGCQKTSHAGVPGEAVRAHRRGTGSVRGVLRRAPFFLKFRNRGSIV